MFSRKKLIRKNAKSIVLFVCFFVFFYFAAMFLSVFLPSSIRSSLGVMTVTGGRSHSLLKFRELENFTGENIEILFLGSSNVERGFDPRIFHQLGYSSFNLASTGQAPNGSFHLAKRYYEKLSPKNVVIGTYWIASSTEKSLTEPAIDVVSNSKISMENVNLVISSKSIPAFHSMVSAYFEQKIRPLDEQEQQPFENTEYIGEGYVQSSRTVRREVALQRVENKTYELSPYLMSYMEKTIEFFQSRGTNVILVRAPVSQEFYESVQNYPEVTKPFDDLAVRYNVPFIDFNDDNHRDKLDLDIEKHLSDRNHLNKNGVQLFNPYALKIIEKHLVE